MSSIAAANNTTVDALMAANQNNKSIKNKNLIIAGGSIALPDTTSSVATGNEITQPATVVAPTNAAGTGAGTPSSPYVAPQTSSTSSVPANVFSPEGISASFGGAMNDISGLEDDLTKMFPSDEEDEYESSREAGAEEIQAQSSQAQDKIQQQKDAGEISKNKALDLLRLGPAGIKQNIDSYIEQSNDFEKGIADDLTTLDAEEKKALNDNDTTYLNAIRQSRMDLINTKISAASTKASLLSSGYSMMLSGQQLQMQQTTFDQTQAQNQLNSLLPVYQGTDPSKIPADVMSQIESAATTLGIPSDAAKAMLTSTGVSKIVAHGNYIYQFDAKGNVVGKIYAPTSSGSSTISDSDSLQAYLDGRSTKLSGNNQATLNALSGNVIGAELLNQRNLATNASKNNGKISIADASGNSTDYNMTTSGPNGRDGYRTAVTNLIISQMDPGTKAKYLGSQSSIASLTPDQQQQLQTIVGQYTDQLLSDNYLTGVASKTSQPIDITIDDSNPDADDSTD